MGVQNLWSILSPVQYHKNLSELKGQVLAVDLSIWVCESQGVKQMQAVVLKPFLRNLFFRITNLTQLGIKLVFVIEGEAPELKCETMMKRQRSTQRGQKTVTVLSKRTGRSHFKARLKECCVMLDYLGIPWVQSKGEAEAMCAYMNSTGLVDACITQDGDAFLYGARVVYRNFTLNSKDPHIDCYSMDDIETKLGLNQKSLVGLGILLGCDYVPKGVPGVGKEGAMKLMKALGKDVDILQRFNDWHQGFPFQSSAERDVMRKAMSVPGFPNQAVIDEFLVPKDKHPRQPFHWSRPNLHKIKIYNQAKLDWPEEYTEDKVLPMLSSHDIHQIIEHGIENCSHCLKPVEIVKTRVRQGIQCVEVHWERQDMSNDDADRPEFYTTVEKLDQFSNAFPEVVKGFMESKACKTKKKDKKPSKNTGGSRISKETNVDALTDAVALLCVNEANFVSDDIQVAEPKLKTQLKKNCIEDTANNQCLAVDQTSGDFSETQGSMMKKTLIKKYHLKEDPQIQSNRKTDLDKICMTDRQNLQSSNGDQREREYVIIKFSNSPEFKTSDALLDTEKMFEKKNKCAELTNEKLTKPKRRTKSSQRDIVSNANGSSKSLKTILNQKHHTTSVNDSKSVFKVESYIDEFNDSWFEEVFLALETNLKNKSCKMDKIRGFGKVAKVNSPDKSSHITESFEVKKQSFSKNGEVYCSENYNKDEGASEPEVLPLSERLMIKSKERKQCKSRKQKSHKKDDADSVVALPDKRNLDNAGQFEKENIVSINSTEIQSSSCHFLFSNILNEKQVLDMLPNKQIISHKTNSFLRKHTCMYDAGEGNSIVKVNLERSVLADDTKLSDFTNLDVSNIDALDCTSCEVASDTQSSNKNGMQNLKNVDEIFDISLQGQIQKDFPELFNCTLPPLLTGGELASPKTDRDLGNCTETDVPFVHQNYAKYGLSERSEVCHRKSDLASAEEDESSGRLNQIKRNEICIGIVESHLQPNKSPEPISLVDRLKQRLGKCKDTKILETMKKVQQHS